MVLDVPSVSSWLLLLMSVSGNIMGMQSWRKQKQQRGQTTIIQKVSAKSGGNGNHGGNRGSHSGNGGSGDSSGGSSGGISSGSCGNDGGGISISSDDGTNISGGGSCGCGCGCGSAMAGADGS